MRPSKGLHLLTGLTVALLIIGLLWISGGFRQLPIKVQSYKPGEVFSIGPATVAVTDGVIARGKDLQGKEHWKIIVRGRITNTTDKMLLKRIEDVAFVMQDGRIVHPKPMGPSTWRLNNRTEALVPPAIENIPFTLEVTYPDYWQPVDRTFAGFWLQEYRVHDTSYGTNEPTWKATHHTIVGAWVPLSHQETD